MQYAGGFGNTSRCSRAVRRFEVCARITADEFRPPVSRAVVTTETRCSRLQVGNREIRCYRLEATRREIPCCQQQREARLEARSCLGHGLQRQALLAPVCRAPFSIATRSTQRMTRKNLAATPREKWFLPGTARSCLLLWLQHKRIPSVVSVSVVSILVLSTRSFGVSL